jgi:hypothetical protein
LVGLGKESEGFVSKVKWEMALCVAINKVTHLFLPLLLFSWLKLSFFIFIFYPSLFGLVIIDAEFDMKNDDSITATAIEGG